MGTLYVPFTLTFVAKTPTFDFAANAAVGTPNIPIIIASRLETKIVRNFFI
jgi:hypothetical protein